MPKKKRYHVIPQMFDVKPAEITGDLDVEKLKKFSRIIKIEKKGNFKNKTEKNIFWSKGIIIKGKRKSARNTNFLDKRSVNFFKKANIIQFNQIVGEKERWPSYVKIKKRTVIKRSFPENHYNERKETKNGKGDDWLQAMWEEKQNENLVK